MDNTLAPQEPAAQLTSLEALAGQPCWYVSCGGSVGGSIDLALGRKIPRSHFVKNPAHTKSFREFQGEFDLLIWGTWRLIRDGQALASSDNEDRPIIEAMERITGRTIERVTWQSTGDFTLDFTDHLCLQVFCDQVGATASIDTNWELTTGGRTVFVDSDLAVRQEPADES